MNMKTSHWAVALAAAAIAAATSSPVAAMPFCNPSIPSSACFPIDPPEVPPIHPGLIRTIELSNTTIRSLSIIGVSAGGHAAGNMEVKIAASPLLESIGCDSTFVTTRKSRDPGRDMFSVLKGALETGRRVSLWVTNNPNFTAYPGRCSVMVAQVL